MSCEIAGTFGPFLGRVGGYGAKGVGINSKGFGTTLARIDHRVALATVKIAPFRSHKRARHAFLYRYTQHWISLRGIFGGDGLSPQAKQSHSISSILESVKKIVRNLCNASVKRGVDLSL
jgi:hypothetical protein